MVHRRRGRGVGGRVTHNPRWPAAIPIGRGPNRLRHRPAWARAARAGPHDRQPACGDAGVPRPRQPNIGAGAEADGEPMHLLVDSTGLKLCGAGEWLLEKHGTRHTVHGEPCTLASAPARARSWPPRCPPRTLMTHPRSIPCCTRSRAQRPRSRAAAPMTMAAFTPASPSIILKRPWLCCGACYGHAERRGRKRADTARPAPATHCRTWSHGSAESVWIHETSPSRCHHGQVETGDRRRVARIRNIAVRLSTPE